MQLTSTNWALSVALMIVLAVPTVIHAERLPDLYTMSFSTRLSPHTLWAGDSLTVTWSGANNGTICLDPPFGPPECPEVFGPAYAPWNDALFLSNDTTWDTGDVLLGLVEAARSLPADGGYSASAAFPVPVDIAPGEYRLIVYIDYLAGQQSGRISESL